MIFHLRALFGEKSVSKVAGVYRLRGDAEHAAADLAGVAGIAPVQLRVLGPLDARRSRREMFGRAVEPEGAAILRTALRAHAITGAIGAALGVLLFAALFLVGQPMVASSPLLAFIAFTGFATTFGLLAGGVLWLRPDHALLIDGLRRALAARRWAVVVHPVNERQFDAARDALRSSGAKVLRTL